MRQSEKINWISGLKGIACLMVFLHHFLISFYPATFYGPDKGMEMTNSGVDATFAYRPWGFINNGNFAVTIFIILAAFLASLKILKLMENGDKIDFLRICGKRYLRLMLNVVFWGSVYFWIMELCVAVGFNDSNYVSQYGFADILKHALFYQWFTEDITVMGTLWTMKALFLGVFISMFLSLFSTKKRWFMPFLLLVVSYGMTQCYTYYGVAVLGTMVADMYYHKRVSQFVDYMAGKKLRLDFLRTLAFRNTCGILLIAAGLVVGGYPTNALPQDTIYKVLAYVMIRIYPDCAIVMIHCLGAILLVFGVMLLTGNPILGSKVCSFLGDISFGVYLIHLLILSSLSYWFTKNFVKLTENYNIGVFLSFIATTVLVLGLAIINHYTIEKWINKLLDMPQKTFEK